MTCIAGISSTDAALPTPTEVGRMLDAAHREASYRESAHVGGGNRYGVGTLTHDFSGLGGTVSGTANPSLSLTLFGDIYEMQGVCEDRYQRFFDGYGTHGDAYLAQLQGAFIAAMYDASTGIVEVANDRFGQRPLYYHCREGVLRFSTSLPSLFAVGVDPAIAPHGLAQFFSFGQYLDCDTLFQNIRVLPAGSVMRFDTNTGTLDVRSYVENPPSPSRHQGRKQWLDAICEATVSAVSNASRDTEGLGLALSGGLDARTILGLIDHSAVELKTICLGMPGSMDLRCAEQMGNIVGCRHHAHLLDQNFIENFESYLHHMVDLTGGQYLSQCIVIPTLPVYHQQGIQVLLRGHAGELMHMSKAYSYSLDDAAMAITTRDQAKAWLFKNLRAYLLDGVHGELFRGEFASAMETAPREAFEQAFDQIPELDDPRQAIWHSFVNDRLRRETTLSLGKFASVCDVRVPFLDRNLIDLLLTAPVELKTDETIQRYILKRCRPELLSVVNANVGSPMTAGPVARRMGELKMRVFAKLGLPGYQPYERMGLWLRRELDEYVRSVLLDEECLDRGVFNPDVVRQVIENHKCRTANHTFLLLAMLIFEVGQRRICRQHNRTGLTRST